MANIKNTEGTPAPIDEAYPDEGYTEVDPRATGGGPLNPENPGFAGQGYQGQGMAAPQYAEQQRMENDGAELGALGEEE